MAFEQDFRHLADDRLLFAGHGRDADIHARQAGHFAAIDADEVRMLGIRGLAGSAQLEPPHMVPQLDPPQHAGFGQFDEIAINRSPIERPREANRSATWAWVKGLVASARLPRKTAIRAAVERMPAARMRWRIHSRVLDDRGSRLLMVCSIENDLPLSFYHPSDWGTRDQEIWHRRTAAHGSSARDARGPTSCLASQAP